MDKSKPFKIILNILLFLILLGGAAGLRFAALDKSLWVDESTSYMIAGQKTAHAALALASERFTAHPPLYYLLVHFWFGLWGKSVIAMRALSALFGVLAVAMMYPLASAIFKRRSAAFAAMALAAASPFMIYISQLGRMYSLLTLLTLVSLWAFARLTDGRAGARGRAALWVVLAAAMTGLIYTHYYGANVAVLLTVLAVVRRKNAGPGFLWKWAALLLVVAAGWSPWIPVFARQSQSVSQIMDSILPGPVQPLQYLAAFIGTGVVFSGVPLVTLTMEQFTALFVFSGLTVFIFFVWSLFLYRKNNKEIGIVYFYYAVPTALMFLSAAMVKGIVFPWHFGYLAPVPILLAAFVLTFGRARMGRAALVFVTTVVCIFGLTAYYRAGFWNDDWRSVSRHIRRHSEKNDMVLSLLPLNDYPLKDYYLKGTGIKVKSAFSSAEHKSMGADTTVMFADAAYKRGCFWVVGAEDVMKISPPPAWREIHFKTSNEKIFPTAFTQKPIKAVRQCMNAMDKPMRGMKKYDFIEYLLTSNKKQSPENAPFARADFMFSHGYYKLAEKEMRDVLKQNPNNADALENMGQILKIEGHEKQAKEYFEQADKVGAKP